MQHANTPIGTVALKVADLSAMTRFYRDTIGLQVRQSADARVELGTQAQTLLILRRLANGRFARRTSGLYHVALRVPTRSELGAWFRRYAAAGAPYWQGASDHGVSEALYLGDPEGNGIEITADTARETWQTQPDGQLAMYVRPLDLQALASAARDEPWQGIAPGTEIGHVHLRVSNLDRARAFYAGLLGLQIKAAFQDAALFLAAGDYHHHVGLNTWQSRGAPALPQDAYGLDEFSIRLEGSDELRALTLKLSAAGYAVQADGADRLVDDPSGNRVRLHAVDEATR
jgi:catechol 2,3-dioxygenase